MAVKVVSEGPVVTRKHTCGNCGYELEFNNVDLVGHRTDHEHDPIETRGRYLVCPRRGCGYRNLVDRERSHW